jgi:hypothetical protein
MTATAMLPLAPFQRELPPQAPRRVPLWQRERVCCELRDQFRGEHRRLLDDLVGDLATLENEYWNRLDACACTGVRWRRAPAGRCGCPRPEQGLTSCEVRNTADGAAGVGADRAADRDVLERWMPACDTPTSDCPACLKRAKRIEAVREECYQLWYALTLRAARAFGDRIDAVWGDTPGWPDGWRQQ